jgi:ADP-ribosyl-[dinitrogen reductase] hydrolase
MSTFEDRAVGALLGLACGDALGRPVEFESAGQIAAEHGELSEMIGHGTWNQPAGTTTDDTAQARAIAESLLDRDGFDADDVAARFVDWYETDPFDVGMMTRKALERLQAGEPWEEAGRAVWEASVEGSNAGNGSVMRAPPLAIPYADAPDELVAVSRDSSRITHADPRCTFGAAVLNLTVAGLLRGESAPLANALDRVESSAPDELLAALEPVAAGEELDALPTSGYVVDTLQTGLHDGLRAGGAEAAIVTAVTRGGDTDTIGAVAGAVAGARFGAGALPGRWLDALEDADALRTVGERLTRLPVS